jgi:hypothetical protein
VKTVWTTWAAARVLPFPGQPWTVRALDLKKSAARVAKAGGGEVPAKAVLADEIARGVTLRLAERYNVQGNDPKETIADDVVDLWVDRGGVPFAIEAAIGVTRTKVGVAPGERYNLRRDGRPWTRLREHAVAGGVDVGALPVVRKAWGKGAWEIGASELPYALAFLTCDRAWVDRVVAQCDVNDKDEVPAPDYGQTCVLAAVTDPARASELLRITDKQPMGFHITEEAYDFIPTLMQVLPDAEAGYLVDIAESCSSKAIRKPWLEIIGSLTTAKAKAFVAKHGAAAPAKKPATKPRSR